MIVAKSIVTHRFCRRLLLICKKSIDFTPCTLLLQWRGLSSGEVATALRPFFFNVHPDLFGQYPRERAVNENSLKLLNSYIATLLQDRPLPSTPTSVTFYLRAFNKTTNGQSTGTFHSVHITLTHRDVRQTVQTILESCDLSTSYLDSIPTCSQSLRSAHNYRHVTETFYGTKEQMETVFRQQEIRAEKLKTETLYMWLQKNMMSARSHLDACKPVWDEIQRLRRNLCEMLGLKDIVWDCGWGTTHFRGCLQSFGALTTHHREHLHALRGRTVVFGRETGVCLDGHIILNSGEVRHNWLDLIKNIPKHDDLILRIPGVQQAVSKNLRDIQLKQRMFQPKLLAESYRAQLRRLATSLADYRGKNSFPQHWPPSLCHLELVVETEAGPLMLSPTGQVIIPSSCPIFLLVNFISDNMEEAKKRLEQYQRNKLEEEKLHSSCLDKLGLLTLEKEDNITPDKMISCLERLLANYQQLQELQGARLSVATYYSVLSDGVICIPWNWKE